MRSELHELSKIKIKEIVPDRKGCYAVFSHDGRCLYVGRSINLKTRMLSHYINGGWRLSGRVERYLTERNAPDGAMFCFWICETLNELERRLIQELKPEENRVWNYRLEIPNSSRGEKVVLVDGRTAQIVGESRDKECWWIVFSGCKIASRHRFHKTRCKKSTT